jgi:hypothetical protein
MGCPVKENPEHCRRATDCEQAPIIARHERALTRYAMSRHAIAEYLVISAAICILIAEWAQWKAMDKIVKSAARIELLVSNQTLIMANQGRSAANQEVIIRNQLDFKKKAGIQ